MLSSYDDIAGLYDAFWSDWYLPAALPPLEKLLFSFLSVGAQVLDVCCGSGHVTQELVRRGYQVTGIDNSAALIEIARRKLPGVTFYVRNVEEMNFDGRFEAALSTFDSMNHLLSLSTLQRAFAKVHDCLISGGRFVFDMNMAEAYFLDVAQWQVTLNDHSVGLVRGQYDPATAKAVTELVWFARQGGSENWIRRTSVVEERCYEQDEIVDALRDAGFETIETVSAYQAGMQPEMAIGRIFFVAVK